MSETSEISTETMSNLSMSDSEDLFVCSSCSNCSVLQCELEKLREQVSEVKDLREHVDELNKLLDHLSSIGCAEYKSDSKMCEASTQTDNMSTESDSDTLFNIYLNSNATQPHAPQPVDITTTTAIPTPIITDIVPVTWYQPQMFNSFCLEDLDRDTKFDELDNRCLAYYGQFAYGYGSIQHPPKSIPHNNYINRIINHLETVIPDFKFNSILLTKYRDGSDFIPYHSDNEPGICENSDIVTLSLGGSRDIHFRSTNGAENILPLSHGDIFSMSKSSQHYFQHSVPKDLNCKVPRISVTFRYLQAPIEHRCSQDNRDIENVAQFLDKLDNASTQPSKSAPPVRKITSSTPADAISTIYISSSMFKELDASKLSSNKLSAAVFSYPGATAVQILARAKKDPKFTCIDPCHVQQIYVLCGTNNVDRILGVPKQRYRDRDIGLNIDRHELEKSYEDITKLTSFLHGWAQSATVNIINILPRESLARNTVINCLNNYIYYLTTKHDYMNFINTELERNLFSTVDGYRKHGFFSVNGSDNVHLTIKGVVRLGKHLKYLAHSCN